MLKLNFFGSTSRPGMKIYNRRSTLLNRVERLVAGHEQLVVHLFDITRADRGPHCMIFAAGAQSLHVDFNYFSAICIIIS